MFPARRRPNGGPGGLGSQGRFPIGTPTSSSPFTHFRLVTQDDNYPDNEDDAESGIPVFRSPSYQVLAGIADSADTQRDMASNHTSPAANQTFADMARSAARAKNREMKQTETPLQTEAGHSTSGFIKLKSKRGRSQSKNWVPLALDDYTTGDDNDPFFAGLKRDAAFPDSSGGSSSVSSHQAPVTNDSEPTFTSTSNLNHPPAQNPPVDSPQMSLSAMSEPFISARPTPQMQPAADDEITRVFGERLPDLIFLSQWEGTVHGEIKFIQHPNRDVSAHQWDIIAYQWVSIGQFSANRKKIEGQLKDERLRGQTVSSSIPPNTLAYFRAVAKQREAAASNPSPRNNDNANASAISQTQRVNTAIPQRPKLQAVAGMNSMDQFGSLSTVSGSAVNLPTRSSLATGRSLPYRDLATSEAPSIASLMSASTLTARDNGTHGMSDDPFMSDRDRTSSWGSTYLHTQESERPGTMDRDYQFPIPQNHPQDRSYNPLNHRTQEQPLTFGTQTYGDNRDGFGNVPGTQVALWDEIRRNGQRNNAGQHDTTQIRSLASGTGLDKESVRRLFQSYDIEDEAVDMSAAYRGRPVTTMQQALADASSEYQPQTRAAIPQIPRALQPPPGLNVGRSRLAPYPTLQGDPDPFQNRKEEIINGQPDEPPNPQVLNTMSMGGCRDCAGPFPTPHAEHANKNEEWWGSGRVDQNDDFVLPSLANARARDPAQAEQYDYIGTQGMLRLFENLAEYAKETDTGERSYFTRNWRVPEPRHMDTSEEGRKSYFATDLALRAKRIREQQRVVELRMRDEQIRAGVGPPSQSRSTETENQARPNVASSSQGRFTDTENEYFKMMRESHNYPNLAQITQILRNNELAQSSNSQSQSSNEQSSSSSNQGLSEQQRNLFNKSHNDLQGWF
ncbi:hypothetical protein EJ05DRAFT_486612 [Pseudovirgaria hyperparasitica]|uniref:Uncharacterized protein n=1 Tax=Pseudovirgaria hyperparasitica TaxID=470096 RepID=A0A6A6W6C3_9PEZI|nr:uncharacterized protein EJ05DRAFT_486612 [Pseudovirgaria hyperparasitica]KAF2757574.1 hypothetical protein EJ05DRAFT_486612 [Pseudovirgaria hyperparasitica]